jgi:tight adherence protein B
MIILWSALACISVFTIVLALGQLISDRSSHPSNRLRNIVPGNRKAANLESNDMPTSSETTSAIGSILSRYNLAERLQVQLYSAGISLRPSEFVGFVISIAVILQCVAVGILHNITAGIVFGLMSVVVPVYGLRSLQNRRKIAFDSQIPDALTLLSSSLKSGFSFLRGMQMIAQEMPPPISQEFRRTVNEVSIGKSLETALNDITARIKSYDIELVVTAVEVHLSVGGNLAEVLEKIAATIQERNKVIGEMRSLTAEGTMSGIILVLLPIAISVILILFNPKYMSVLLDETLGHYLIGFAIVLQIVGILAIKSMLVLDI